MSLEAQIKRLLPGWLKEPAPDGDIVFSSRVRLARNINQISFPYHAGEVQLEEVIDQIGAALKSSSQFENFVLQRLDDMAQHDRVVLVEKYLVSLDLLKNPAHRGVVLNQDETVAIMLNEEDHLRIQSILPGLQLKKAWESAEQIDQLLEVKLDFAFDEEKGYLTTCPTNVGTGLRASVLVHLPALKMVGQVKKVLSVLPNVGLNVRGAYGEGTDSAGDLYQISNQVTLGLSEEEVIGKIVSVTKQVIDQERAARDALLANESRLQLENRVNRAYGLLTHSRLISSEETIKLLSDVLMGAVMNLIPKAEGQTVKELFFLIRPAILQKLIGRELSPGERDHYRAAVIREHLATSSK